MDDVSLYRQVIINKVSWKGVVSINTAYLGRGQIDLIWLLYFKESLYSSLIGEIELRMSTSDNIAKAFGL